MEKFFHLPDKDIILTGFMGAGKTSAGKELARLTGRKFLDTDQEVELKEGRSIPAIFESCGENYFRQLEAEIISSLDGYPPGKLVVSTGGGAVLREDNCRLLRRRGIVVLLSATPAEILERIRGEKGIRPLLEHSQPEKRISALLNEREKVYREAAHLILDTSGSYPGQVALTILDELRGYSK